MTVSPAKLAANRANCLKARGPVTPEGRARSRQNALKHGMAGDGTVIPAVDSAEVQRRSHAMQREMGPRSEMGKILVNRMAELSVRVERCSKQERAMTEARVARAFEDFDEARVAEVDRLFASIAESPATATRALRSMPEGCDRLVGALLDLRDRLAEGHWDPALGERLAGLTGSSWGEVPACRPRALTEAVAGDFRNLGAADGAGMFPGDRMTFARQALVGLIDAEVEMLLEHREALDLEGIERERAGAPARALFDPSRQASLARRYEAAAERAFYKAYRDLDRVEAEALEADPAPIEADPDPVDEEEAVEELGSFRAAPRRSIGPVDSGYPETPSVHPEDRNEALATIPPGVNRAV